MSNEFETQPSRFQKPEGEKEIILHGAPISVVDRMRASEIPTSPYPDETLPAKVQVGKLVMSVRDAGKNIAGVDVIVLTSERGTEYSMAKSVFLYHLLIGRYEEVE